MFLQPFLDKFDYLRYKKKIVIGKRKYQWCTIPVPEGYPKQSQTHPSILYCKQKWNNYTHWLATTPYPNADIRYENPCIYKSNNPIDFTPIKNNPIVLCSGGEAFNSDPELFLEQKKLYCINRENNHHHLYDVQLLSTLDGDNWTKPISIYSSDDLHRQLLSPSYIKVENKHRIYFLNGDAGISKNGHCSGIEIIEGTNLDIPDFSFKQTGRFLNSKDLGVEPWHFDLFSFNGKLYMILCARDTKKKTLRSPMNTYLAVSDDEINFIIFPKPIVNYLKSYRPSAYVDENGVLHLYFSIVGTFLKDGSDRNIGYTSMLFEDLLSDL